MMLSVFHKIIRTILIVIPIITLGWLTFEELVPSGRVKATYDMRRETPFISKLYPRDRVSEVKKTLNGDFYRSFLAEPVYFDLKPNTQFEKVTVTVKYKVLDQAPLKMGGLVNKKDWLFDWRDFPSGAVGWQTQTEVFNLRELVPEGEKFRFGFSAPGLMAGQVEISELKVIFEKKPLTGREAVNKILDAVVWRINRLLN